MGYLIISTILGPLLLLPLAYKWELERKPVLTAGALIGMFSGAVVHVLSALINLSASGRIVCSVMIIYGIAVALLLIRFYRDPSRITPEGENAIIAPADGTIKYIKRIEPNDIPCSTKGHEQVMLPPAFVDILPEKKGYLVGIAMTFLDVHVTRAPIAGELLYSEHIAGQFLSLKAPEALYRNERTNLVIGRDGYGIGIIHIASRLVRQIVTYVSKGESLLLGQRIGMIRFGSQVDILVPDREGIRLMVKEGERVFAGISTVAIFDETEKG